MHCEAHGWVVHRKLRRGACIGKASLFILSIRLLQPDSLKIKMKVSNRCYNDRLSEGNVALVITTYSFPQPCTISAPSNE